MNFFNAYVASEAVASEAVPGRRSIFFFNAYVASDSQGVHKFSKVSI